MQQTICKCRIMDAKYIWLNSREYDSFLKIGRLSLRETSIFLTLADHLELNNVYQWQIVKKKCLQWGFRMQFFCLILTMLTLMNSFCFLSDFKLVNIIVQLFIAQQNKFISFWCSYLYNFFLLLEMRWMVNVILADLPHFYRSKTIGKRNFLHLNRCLKVENNWIYFFRSLDEWIVNMNNWRIFFFRYLWNGVWVVADKCYFPFFQHFNVFLVPMIGKYKYKNQIISFW